LNWRLVTCLAALALIAAKLLGLMDWSWWLVTAPLWLWAVIVLITGGALTALLSRPPRKMLKPACFRRPNAARVAARVVKMIESSMESSAIG